MTTNHGLLHPHVTVVLPVRSILIILQACGSTHQDVSVNAQPDLDHENLKAIATENNKKIQGLKTENDIEVSSELEVRNVSVYRVFVIQTSTKLQSVIIFMPCACDFYADLNFPFCRAVIYVGDTFV
jgi:hypothetical protein